jgi:hypothetical protein
MPAADVERFEAGAGGLLDKLYYPRVFPRPKNWKARRESGVC